MSKITVAKPDVGRDGDRMTRCVGDIITQKLFPPLLETDHVDDARGSAARDDTDGLFAITVAHAIKQTGVGVKSPAPAP